MPDGISLIGSWHQHDVDGELVPSDNDRSAWQSFARCYGGICVGVIVGPDPSRARLFGSDNGWYFPRYAAWISDGSSTRPITIEFKED